MGDSIRTWITILMSVVGLLGIAFTIFERAVIDPLDAKASKVDALVEEVKRIDQLNEKLNRITGRGQHVCDIMFRRLRILEKKQGLEIDADKVCDRYRP